MIKDGLYHKDIFMPPLRLGNGMIKLNYSLHALDSAYNDRYDIIKLEECYNFSKAEIVEVEVKNGVAIKVVARFDYNDKYDLTIVVVPQTKIVKTVWLNRKDDIHNTLDATKYVDNKKHVCA